MTLRTGERQVLRGVSSAVPVALRVIVGAALITTAAPLSMSFVQRPLPIYDIAMIAVAIAGLLHGLRSFIVHHRLGVSGVSGVSGVRGVRGFMPGTLALVAAVIGSGIAHPSSRLIESVLIILGTVAVGWVMSRAVRSSHISGLIRVITVFVFAQLAVSLLQIRRDGAIGGQWFGESESGFRRIGGILSPSGTLVHANALGSVTAITTIILLALISHQPPVGQSKFDRALGGAGATASAALTVLSLTRSAVASVVVLLAVSGFSKHRRALAPTLAAIIAVSAMSGFARSDAWIERGRVSAGGVEAAGSGRVALSRQAIAIFRLDPIFGVGPGHYFAAIREHPKIAQLSTETVAVHNVWLYVLATLGMVGVIALAWLSIDIIRRAYRGGFWTLGLLVALVPPLMLDAAPFMGCGLMWTAAAIGCVVGLCPVPSISKPHRLGASTEQVEEPSLQRGVFADSSAGA